MGSLVFVGPHALLGRLLLCCLAQPSHRVWLHGWSLVQEAEQGVFGERAAGQIFYDIFQARFGSGQGGVIAMGIPLVAALGCGALSVASNSR